MGNYVEEVLALVLKNVFVFGEKARVDERLAIEFLSYSLDRSQVYWEML